MKGGVNLVTFQTEDGEGEAYREAPVNGNARWQVNLPWTCFLFSGPKDLLIKRVSELIKRQDAGEGCFINEQNIVVPYEEDK